MPRASNKLTKAQQSGLDQIAANGGTIYRLPNGFWSVKGASSYQHQFTPRMIQEYITAGRLRYSKRSSDKGALYYVEAEIVPLPSKPQVVK